jgi:hypothetical protein
VWNLLHPFFTGSRNKNLDLREIARFLFNSRLAIFSPLVAYRTSRQCSAGFFFLSTACLNALQTEQIVLMIGSQLQQRNERESD